MAGHRYRDIALREQPFPVEVGRLVRMLQAVAVEVEHRPAPAGVAVHERVGGTGGALPDAEPAGERPREGGLARA